MSEKYDAGQLHVLEGLEAVRMRPGMYIGTTGAKGMHHILWEIVDNSIDEVANKYGTTIDIIIHEDNSVTVKDDGRGIPADIHPVYKVSGIELVFTKLHAGGKFGNDNYKYSGGLHGVGAAVTNALSKWLVADVYKNGTHYQQKFHSYKEKDKYKCGIPEGAFTTEPCDELLRGTSVTFLPDEDVFKKEKFSFDVINRRIRELAFLNAGLIITLTDEREVELDGEFKHVRYHYTGGIKDFVKYLDNNKTVMYDEPIYIAKEVGNFYLELAIQHTDGYTENICSYVNNIPTSEGGTHETGFKSGYTKVLNDYGRQKGYIKEKQDNYDGEDFREGMTAVLSIKMQNIQFEGQTKSKLGNPEVRPQVENIVVECLSDYLVKAKKDLLDKLYDKATQAAKARESAQKAKQLSRQKNQVSNSNNLVGKLSACTGKDYSRNEIFIVEGDSAGGTAKQGRDRSFQAILPLRGKPLNAEKKRVTEILANEEIVSIINALGAGFDDSFNVDNLKYDKVIILADADQDGAHIRSILLTFFFRYMKDLVAQGHVYIGMPPLYKVATKTKTLYAYDDEELREVLKEVGSRYELQRFKGLGEMSADQLWETTMSPMSRTMMRVTIDDAAEADKMISTLMGDNIEARKQYINEHANFNKIDTFEEIGG